MDVGVGPGAVPLVLQETNLLLVAVVPVVLVDLPPVLRVVVHPRHMSTLPPGDGALGRGLVDLVAGLDGVALPVLGSAEVPHDDAVGLRDTPLSVAHAAALLHAADVVFAVALAGVGIRPGVLVALQCEGLSRLRADQGGTDDGRRHQRGGIKGPSGPRVGRHE